MASQVCANAWSLGEALRRPRDVERPAHREMLSLVVQHMQLRRIEIAAGGAVADERIILPAVPQPAHDFGELDDPVVALVMLEMRIAAEILGFRQVRRGDDVPAGAAAADMIERGEFAGDVVGLVVARRRRRHEADMLGHRVDRGQQGDPDRNTPCIAGQRLSAVSLPSRTASA